MKKGRKEEVKRRNGKEKWGKKVRGMKGGRGRRN